MNNEHIKEQMEAVEKEKWKAFCATFPNITRRGFWAKLAWVFCRSATDDLPEAIWRNGFYQGVNEGMEFMQRSQSFPQAPKSTQPE
jgi:hypothetical protein